MILLLSSPVVGNQPISGRVHDKQYVRQGARVHVRPIDEMVLLLGGWNVVEHDFKYASDHKKTVAHEELEHEKLETLKLLERVLMRSTCSEH